jgi:hypothetical protein
MKQKIETSRHAVGIIQIQSSIPELQASSPPTHSAVEDGGLGTVVMGPFGNQNQRRGISAPQTVQAELSPCTVTRNTPITYPVT